MKACAKSPVILCQVLHIEWQGKDTSKGQSSTIQGQPLSYANVRMRIIKCAPNPSRWRGIPEERGAREIFISRLSTARYSFLLLCASVSVLRTHRLASTRFSAARVIRRSHVRPKDSSDERSACVLAQSFRLHGARRQEYKRVHTLPCNSP